MTARTDADDRRKRELAAIHCRIKELAMDDDTYRAMLWTVARVHSARDLDHAGRRRVLDHMRRLSGKPPIAPDVPRPLSSKASPDKAPLLAKIETMVAARGREIAYAEGMAKKMFNAERLEWCTPEQLRRIVAALVYDQRRHDART